MSGGDRGYQASMLVRLPTLVVLVGVLCSGALHSGILWYFFDSPLGHVDPEWLEMTNGPVRIKRAAYDKVIDDYAAGGNGGGENGTGNELPKDITDQGRDLLENVDAPINKTIEQLDMQLRNPDESEEREDMLAIELPTFELPNDVLEIDEQLIADQGFKDVNDIGLGAEAINVQSSQAQASQMLNDIPGSAAFGPGIGSGTGQGGIGEGNGYKRIRSIGREHKDAIDRETSRFIDRQIKEDKIPLDMLIELPDPIGDDDALAIFQKPKPLDTDFDYLVTRYDPNDEDGYFEVEVSALRSLKKLPTMKKDVVFLVDTSSSIDQEWVNQVMRGIGPSLRMMNEGDRFNIVLFNEKIRFFSRTGLVDATPANIERASKFIWNTEAKGATDVNAALSQMLARDINHDRVYDIVLISDGMPTRGVMDTRKLINLITKNNDLNASIYCIGIGGKQNRELLNFLAYRNKGYCLFVEQRGLTMDVVTDMMSRLRYPIIKDLKVNVAGKTVSEVYPINLANIHQGERFSILGRFNRSDDFMIQVMGYNNGQPVDFTLNRNLRNAQGGQGQIAYDWAFWKLHHLYSEILRKGMTNDLKLQIAKIRNRFKMKTVY
ncbi:VWA domain-containing protein [Planctomycetota bacterium]|nr:VWA domain-containing protein [Planctomycetota bacterium]